MPIIFDMVGRLFLLGRVREEIREVTEEWVTHGRKGHIRIFRASGSCFKRADAQRDHPGPQ